MVKDKINGNVCINRLYGIVYPAFALGGVKQESIPTVSMEYGTPLNAIGVTTTQTAVGLSVLGLVSKASGGPGTTGNGTSSSPGTGIG